MAGLSSEEYGKPQTRRTQDQLTIASLILDGNAYLKIWRGESGNVLGLQWLPHWDVDPVSVAGNPNGLRAFRYAFGGTIRECPPGDMIHITAGLPDANDPLKSVSPVKAVMREVMTDQQIAVFTYAIMRQPNPAATITPKEGSWTQSQAEDVASVLRQRSAGESAGSVMVMGANATISKLGLTPEEMALDVIPAHIERRISAVLGISPLVSGLASDPTYSNYKTAREAATEEFLVPMWQLVADSMSDALVPEFGNRNGGWRLAYDLTNVRSQQEDRDALHARVREDFDKNLIDLFTAKTETGRVPENSDKGVYAWMLKNAGVAPQASKGAAARKRAEESL
jgi:HK97 family phage portal protein